MDIKRQDLIAEHTEAWRTLKRSLVESSKFVEDIVEPIEAQVRSRLKEKGPYPNKLYADHWDYYLSDISSALDRCLSYRREARDLEIAAVKAAVDYSHFIASSAVSRSLEIAALGLPSATARLKQVIAAIAESPNSEVGVALKAYLEIERVTLDTGLASLAERQELIEKKWDELTRVADEYHTRHTAVGNAHNFVERFNRVLDIYADDLFDVVSKIPFVEEGISLTYGPMTEAPSDDEPSGYLDRVVTWTRDVTRLVNGFTEQETKFDLVVPLVQPWRGKEEKSFVDPDTFYEIFHSDKSVKEIQFDFRDVFFGIEHLRIFGVGISFGSEPWGSSNGSVGWRDTVTGYRLRVTIHTPEQKDHAGQAYSRPPIVFGNVAIHGAEAPVAWYDGPNCTNLRPDGRWSIAVEDLAVWLNGKRASVKSGFFSSKVLDIKLHLRVVGVLTPKSGSYFSK